MPGSDESPALLLRVHKPWFDAIAHGHKKYEYRRVTPYWTTRIQDRHYTKIVFQNGYGARFPTMDVEYLGYDIIVNEHGEPHYRLRLGAVSNVLNYTIDTDIAAQDTGTCIDLNQCLDAGAPRAYMRFSPPRNAWRPRRLPHPACETEAVDVESAIQTASAAPAALPPAAPQGDVAVTGGGAAAAAAPAPSAATGLPKGTVVGEISLLI